MLGRAAGGGFAPAYAAAPPMATSRRRRDGCVAAEDWRGRRRRHKMWLQHGGGGMAAFSGKEAAQAWRQEGRTGGAARGGMPPYYLLLCLVLLAAPATCSAAASVPSIAMASTRLLRVTPLCDKRTTFHFAFTVPAVRAALPFSISYVRVRCDDCVNKRAGHSLRAVAGCHHSPSVRSAFSVMSGKHFAVPFRRALSCSVYQAHLYYHAISSFSFCLLATLRCCQRGIPAPSPLCAGMAF